jgi:hypothetical protein
MEFTERDYDIYNKELLTVVEAFKHWQSDCHVAGFPFWSLPTIKTYITPPHQ